ncbi:MAG: putative amidohydrolase [Alteromonadaceae bacterium]|jgi:predicted amidohydrolase
MVNLVAMQLCSVPDVSANLSVIEQQLSTLSRDEQHLVVLPECCLFFGGKDAEQLSLAQNTFLQTESMSSLAVSLSALARKYNVYLVAGSMPILTENKDKFTNSSCVFSPQGEQLARYDKIHLFDVNVDDNEKNYRESNYTQAGKQAILAKTSFANVGLSICYDLRFPELYRYLRGQGADIITVPSAFTQVTGNAHWQALLQARAIENQVYIIAAAQQGVHENGRETWGHSLIISPWGEILTSLATGVGLINAKYSPEKLAKVRSSMPVFEHNQFKVNLK